MKKNRNNLRTAGREKMYQQLEYYDKLEVDNLIGGISSDCVKVGGNVIDDMELFIGTLNPSQLHLMTNGQNRVVITESGQVVIGNAIPTFQLNLSQSLQLPVTTGGNLGVIYKDGNRFIHDFQHPTGGTAIPSGQNTFIGVNAGNFTMGVTASSDHDASYNTGVGASTLVANTIGSNNTAIGRMSLVGNTIGSFNNAVGNNSLGSNTIGNQNNCFGSSSMASNTTGGLNVAVGDNSLQWNISGSNNVVIGSRAGRLNADGSNRTTGSFGVYIGSDVRSSADGTTNEIVIGSNAIGMGSNIAVYGNTSILRHVFQSGNVGIGTSTPGHQLSITQSMRLEVTTSSSVGVIYKVGNRFIHDFQHPTGGTAIPSGQNTFIGVNAGNFTMGSTASITAHGSFNTGIGFSSLQSNTLGFANTAIGRLSLQINTSGSGNTAVGNSCMQGNTTGGENVAAGDSALLNNTTGSNNVVIGVNAARHIADGVTSRTTGNLGVYIGNGVRASAEGTSNEIVIGASAIGQGSNTIVLGHTTNVATFIRGIVNITNLRFAAMHTDIPSTPTSTGTLGDFRVTSGFIFICYATNQWARIPTQTTW